MLAAYAVPVEHSRGRRFPEAQHPYRNDFQRDRDRVIHARAFRRLEAKTQVFTRRYSDHFRNRLTHTLEVAQVSRTIAGALGLNTDLAEVLALVHDIGHPPFGHAGEKALDAAMREQGLFFDHNLHALRIVERFEQRYLDFPGLNLTFEVREGIIKHSGDCSVRDFPLLAEYRLDERPPLEAQLIDLVTSRISLPRRPAIRRRVFGADNGDRVGGTDGRAKLAADAPFLAVGIAPQFVEAVEPRCVLLLHRGIRDRRMLAEHEAEGDRQAP